MSEFVTVANVSQIPSGRGLSIRLNGKELALFNVEGEYFVLDDRCPHRGGPLGHGMVENGRVCCPLHGWRFDLRTGGCLDHADRSVRCHQTRVVNGCLQVEVENL